MLRPLTSAPIKVGQRLHVWNGCLSQSCTIRLAPSVSEISPKENYSEQSDQNGGRKNSVSRLRVLIS